MNLTIHTRNWAQAIALQVSSPFEIAIVGNDWKEKLNQFQKYFLSNSIYLGGNTEGSFSLLQDKLMPGKTMIYVCKNKTCKMPVEEVDDALKQIKSQMLP